MLEYRITKLIYLWDISLGVKGNWYTGFVKICRLIDYTLTYSILTPIDSKDFRSKCSVYLERVWKVDCCRLTKLTLYREFRLDLKMSSCLEMYTNKYTRSTYAEFRSDILKLHIETGRCRNIPRHERTCSICKSDAVGDQFHFVFTAQHMPFHVTFWLI